MSSVQENVPHLLKCQPASIVFTLDNIIKLAVPLFFSSRQATVSLQRHLGLTLSFIQN